MVERFPDFKFSKERVAGSRSFKDFDSNGTMSPGSFVYIGKEPSSYQLLKKNVVPA